MRTITLALIGAGLAAAVAAAAPPPAKAETDHTIQNNGRISHGHGGYHGGGYRGGYRGGYYDGDRGWGGFAAGAILGGLLAAPYYDNGAYAYEPGYGGNAVADCMRRFKSYDPGSGTYLGYDGYRHSCP